MRRLVIVVMVIALCALPVLSCFSERDEPLAPESGDDCSIPASAIGPGRAVVLIRGFRFLPDTVRIRPGTRVTWVNCESSSVEPHTSTALGQVWDSGPIAPGTSYAVDFEATGLTGYFCRPHPSMRGVVIVE